MDRCCGISLNLFVKLYNVWIMSLVQFNSRSGNTILCIFFFSSSISNSICYFWNLPNFALCIIIVREDSMSPSDSIWFIRRVWLVYLEGTICVVRGQHYFLSWTDMNAPQHSTNTSMCYLYMDYLQLWIRVGSQGLTYFSINVALY